jgi:hypothetical protein
MTTLILRIMRVLSTAGWRLVLSDKDDTCTRTPGRTGKPRQPLSYQESFTSWANRPPTERAGGRSHRPEVPPGTYRISRNEVTSGSVLVPFGHKAFGDGLAVTLFGEPL